MNLMFWKKKTGAEEDAAQEGAVRNSRDSLDFIEGEAETTVPDETEGSSEPPAWQGSWLDSLRRRFRKAPAFRAESMPAGEASETADETSSDMEESPRPGWPARIKLQLAAVLRRFRKVPAADEEAIEESGGTGEAGETEESGAHAKAGLLARLRAAFSAFTRELRAPAAPAAAEEGDEEEKAGARGRPEAESFEEATGEAEEGTRPVRSKKRLVIAAAILLALMLAAGAGVALLPLLEPPEKRWGTKHDTTSISSRPLEQDAASGEPQSEVDALRKENAELQARIEALRKEPTPQQATVPPPRQVYVPPPRQGREGKAAAAAPAAGEELTIGTSDPKAAAMTLKEAIEAMNAASGDSARKPAK